MAVSISFCKLFKKVIMPIDPVTAAAIAGGAQLATGALSGAMTGASNKKARQHEKAMLDYINRYNTPANQAKRLIAGGFNPHLVYGNGSIANTSAPANLPNLETPQVPDFGQAIGSYNDLTMNDSQRRNTDTATATMAAQSDADLKEQTDKYQAAAEGTFSPDSSTRNSWQSAMDTGWFEPVTRQGCQPYSATIGGRTWNLDICPTAEKISVISEYVIWFLLVVGTFVMLTGGAVSRNS